jgi:hypothetical protein
MRLLTWIEISDMLSRDAAMGAAYFSIPKPLRGRHQGKE